MLVPALRFLALPDAAALCHWLRSRMPAYLCPAPGNDYDVSLDLTAELAGIIDISEEEARLNRPLR